jgi:alpha-glucosidase
LTGARFQFENADLEIVFLDSDVVRLSWTPGHPPIPYAITGFNWPGAETTLSETGEGWRFQSEAIVIDVGEEGNLTLADITGKILRQDDPPTLTGESWTHRAKMTTEAAYYGLGERAANLNLRGGTYRLWNQSPGGSYKDGADPLYVCIPVYLCLQHEGAYLVFYENTYDGAIAFPAPALVTGLSSVPLGI